MDLRLRRNVWAGNKCGGDPHINSNEIWEKIILTRLLKKTDEATIENYVTMLHHYVEVPKY